MPNRKRTKRSLKTCPYCRTVIQDVQRHIRESCRHAPKEKQNLEIRNRNKTKLPCNICKKIYTWNYLKHHVCRAHCPPSELYQNQTALASNSASRFDQDYDSNSENKPTFDPA